MAWVFYTNRGVNLNCIRRVEKDEWHGAGTTEYQLSFYEKDGSSFVQTFRNEGLRDEAFSVLRDLLLTE